MMLVSVKDRQPCWEVGAEQFPRTGADAALRYDSDLFVSLSLKEMELWEVSKLQ